MGRDTYNKVPGKLVLPGHLNLGGLRASEDGSGCSGVGLGPIDLSCSSDRFDYGDRFWDIKSKYFT